jgi:hypothetical protein
MCLGRSGAAHTNIFLTIGHSTRTIVEFADLLRESGADFVIDVRSIPRSRTNPQFNRETLQGTLEPWQIGYEHIPELGGRRGKSRDVGPSPNSYWRVQSFQNYADYALTAPFAAGLARLRERGGRHRCAVMCAEAVWWRCHRRIIADYLLAAGEQVMHILGKSHVDVASFTPGAFVRNDRTVVYPAQDTQPEWGKSFRGSTAEGNVQSGDDADHGETVTAEPDRDDGCKPDIWMYIIQSPPADQARWWNSAINKRIMLTTISKM